MAEASKLIEVLKQIEACVEIEKIIPDADELLSEDLTYHEDRLHPLVREALGLADSVLITPKGSPHYDHIRTLKEAGFRVRAGQSDSFGWVSGIIHTAKGKIIFG